MLKKLLLILGIPVLALAQNTCQILSNGWLGCSILPTTCQSGVSSSVYLFSSNSVFDCVGNAYVLRSVPGGDYVNVKAYGAKGDERTVSDGAITGSTATLTSASANFTQADNRKIAVVMAGSQGIATGTYTSGGTITGSLGQTCTLSFTGGATALAYLTSSNTIASGANLVITAAGPGYTSAPTSATLGSGSATCSGTATVVTTLFILPLVTYVSGVVNSTTITLGANATTTVTGANVWIGTDDGPAFTSALAAAQAVGSCVFLPQGTYRIATAINITTQNNCLQGVMSLPPNPPQGATIDSNLSGAIFSLGTFSSTSSPFVNTSQGFQVKQVTIENASEINLNFTGSRVTAGIQANGNGQVVLEDVNFYGLQYGFAAPYGSGYDRLNRVTAQNNDIGIYQGYSSEQFSWIALQLTLNDYGMVLDGAQQGGITDIHCVDNRSGCGLLEANIPNRFGYNWVGMGTEANDYNLNIKNVWVETGAGFTLPWQEYSQFSTNSTTGNVTYPRNVTVDGIMGIFGSTGLPTKDGVTHSIFQMNTGKFFTMRNATVETGRLDTIVNPIGSSSLGTYSVEDVRFPDGNTAVPPYVLGTGVSSFQGFGYSNKYLTSSIGSGACGTSSSLSANSTDQQGRVVVGSGTTTCTVTFATQTTYTRSCTVSSESGLALSVSYTNTNPSSFTVSASSLASSIFDYVCRNQ